MTDYFGAGMRLYLDRLVDWEGQQENSKGRLERDEQLLVQLAAGRI